jgi:hypothetical protein
VFRKPGSPGAGAHHPARREWPHLGNGNCFHGRQSAEDALAAIRPPPPRPDLRCRVRRSRRPRRARVTLARPRGGLWPGPVFRNDTPNYGRNTSGVSREPFPQPGEQLVDAPVAPDRVRGGEPGSPASAQEPKRFIGGIGWGTWPLRWRASWPLAELVVTNDEVIVRPRRFARFLCPRGARYSIAELSFAEVGAWGIRFSSAKDPRKITFSGPGNKQVARLLVHRGIELRDRRGGLKSGSEP